DVRIKAGTLRVSSDANLGSTFKTIRTFGTLEADGTFSTAKTIEPSNGVIRITAGNTLTLTNSGQLGGSTSDALTKDGPGTLRILGQSSRFGTTTLLAGTTRLENGGSVGYGTVDIGNGATPEGSGMSDVGATG